MSSNAEIIFTGDAKGLLDEYKKLEAANKKLEEQLAKQVKVARANARSEEKLRRDVMRAVEAARTPVEKYNAALAQYKTALDKGMISQAQFTSIQKAASNELKKSADNAKGFGDNLTASIMKAGLVKTAFQSVTAAITAMIEEEKKIRSDASLSNMSVDDMSRAYAIQAGLTDEQRVTSRDEILNIAKANGAKADKAFAAATQLVSSGFADPIKTGTLDSFLKTLATSNLKGGDPVQLAQAMSQFMGAYGKEKSQENMLELGVKMRGLFKDTDVQVSDLSDFAKAAPGFAAAGIPLDEALGLLTELRKTMSASESATAGRNIIGSLRTAGGDKAKTDALAAMGLTADQVDIVGETASEALMRVRDAVAKMPEEARAPTLKKLFQQENVNAAQIMLSGLGNVPTNIKSMQDTAGFAAGVNMAMGADSATAARQEIDQQRAMMKENAYIEGERAFDQAARLQYEQSVLENAKEDSVLNRTFGRASIWLNKQAAETFYATGLSSKDEYMNNIRPLQDQAFDTLSGSSGPGYTPPARSQNFTEAELKSRLGRDPQMDKQTGVLQDISNKLTVRPVNPNLEGRRP